MAFKNPGILKFKAVIQGEGVEDQGGAFVLFPFDAEEKFGPKNGRVPVKATFDGEPYQGQLIRYGRPEHLIIITKDIRSKIGKKAGDEIDVTIELDDKPRMAEIPDDLKEAFKNHKGMEEFFKSLAPSHQKEYVRNIVEAKQEETRIRRIEKTIQMLKEKMTAKK